MPYLTQLVIVGYVMSIGFVATDIYFPSMPAMADYFRVQENIIQLTVPSFFMGAVIAGLVIGPLSDMWGRRKIFLYSLLGAMISSLACAVVSDVTLLLVARFFQGAANGIIGVIGLAIPQDLYKGKDNSRAMSILGGIFVIAPSIAPYIGGLIHVRYGWQMIFYLLSLLSFIGLIVSVIKLPETNPPVPGKIFSFKEICHQYRKIVTHKLYVIYAIQTPIGYAAEICYLTVLPIYFITVLGLEPDEYGLYVFGIIITYMLGTYSGAKALGIFDEEMILRIGLGISLLGGTLLGGLCYFNLASALMVTVALAVHHFGMAWIYAPALAKALQLFPHERGSASAIRVTMSYICAVIGGYVASIVDDKTMIPAMLFTVLASIIGILIFCFKENKKMNVS